MKDNIDRLFEAIEHPEIFSDEDLEKLLRDPDTRELYNMMSRASDALTETSVPNIDKEWDSFSNKHSGPRKKRHIFKVFFSRQAAVVATIIVISLTVVATTIGVKYVIARHEARSSVATIRQEPASPALENVATPDSVSASGTTAPHTIIFKDETFENIIHAICDYYNAEVVFNSDEPKELRLYFKWDKTLSLDETVCQLNNFGQIHITINGRTLSID